MLLKVVPGVAIALPEDNTEKMVALHYTTEKLIQPICEWA